MITSATNSTTESRELKLLLFHIKSYPYFNQMSCRWNSHDQKTYIWLRTYRSLIFVPHDSKSGMLLFISSHIEKRTWSQLLSLVPRFKGLRIAQSVETSNADQPHERFIYNDARWRLGTIVAVHHQRSVYLHTPYKGHFPLLCSWLDD